MIISLNWLKKFTSIDLRIDELATLIGARLVEIEEVNNIGEKYKNVTIVKVVSADKLEGSDHLNVTKIDDGRVTPNVVRDEFGLIQVVCGAPNVKAGQLVAWLPPESVVPQTFGKAEPFILGTRDLRGVTSSGMIASPQELDLSDDHDGILEIVGDIAPGTLFKDVYELDDYLLDIENKSLTHRPDCFGIVGFAREVAAIQGKAFETPDWLKPKANNYNQDQPKTVGLKANIDDVELSARYSAIVMSVADGAKKSPIQIQTYLSRVGVRPISAVVDVTNYLMMLTGQPLHAFDYDKLIALNDSKAEIHVRAGRDKEKLALLDGRTIELTADDIVIASGETAIGLAGAMGGANTAIDANTKNIIIESATFNLYKLRATQMRHGIFSEAITRFTKGQPAELSALVLTEAVRLTEEWAGAKSVSNVAESYPGNNQEPIIELSVSTINNILGSGFNNHDVIRTLQNVGFLAEQTGSDLLRVTAPYWRADIHLPEDIIEEIGRLNGFDNINPTLPERNFTAVRPDDFDTFRNKLRKLLVRSGANEVLNYSFVHGDVINKASQKVDNSYKIINSISPDLQYYRQSLTPSLLGLVYPNIKQGYDSFALFEINKTHQKQDGMTNENVPIESDATALVIASKNKQSGAAYYQAKLTFDYVCKALGLKLSYRPIDSELGTAVSLPFEYRRSAEVVDTATGRIVGIIGEYKKSVTKGFKLPDYTAGFEISTRALFESTKATGYRPLSRYPATERDICFQVNEKVTYSQVAEAVETALNGVKLEPCVSPVDIYQTDNATTKNITIRIKLTAHDHTLTGDEVNEVVKSITASAISNAHAIVI
ncbi:MAG: phenylalanine--tRNA ligase subunit beta [Candidatus Saccharibacteria bacterium]